MTPGVTGLKMTKPAAYNKTGTAGWTSDAENNSTAQDPGGDDKEPRIPGSKQIQIPNSNSKFKFQNEQSSKIQNARQRQANPA